MAIKTSHKLVAGILLLVIVVTGYFVFDAAFSDHNKPPSPTTAAINGSSTAAAAESKPATESTQQSSDSSNNTGVSKPSELTTGTPNRPVTTNGMEVISVSANAGSTRLNAAAPNGQASGGEQATSNESANLAPSAGGSQEQQQAQAAQQQRHQPIGMPATETERPAPSYVSSSQDSAAMSTSTTATPTMAMASGVGVTSSPNAVVAKGAAEENEERDWREFKANYSRSYSDFEEEQKRRKIFSDNWRFINEFNGNQSVLFVLGINQFADLTRDEINSHFVGPLTSWQETINELPTPVPPPMHTIVEAENSGSTQTIDWRNVTSGPPVDQSNCTDSAVYAAVASIESAYNSAMLLMNPEAIPLKLSERQALTCLSLARPEICKGGASMAFVFRSLQYLAPDGLSSTQAFDEAQVMPGTCELPAGDMPRVKLATYSLVHEDNIPEALNSVPLVVALDASQTTFHFYKSGLYHQLGCDQDSYNQHALLVGYSTGDELQAHYLLRNSWGSTWGEQGHMRLLKNKQINTCLPLRMAIYPNLS